MYINGVFFCLEKDRDRVWFKEQCLLVQFARLLSNPIESPLQISTCIDSKFSLRTEGEVH